MTRQEFSQLRERGFLLNERVMNPTNRNAHLQEEEVVWFVEFPDESWLRNDRINYTHDPCKAARFLSKYEADKFIEYYILNEFGAIATEHQFTM
jgi:hypothetical protein